MSATISQGRQRESIANFEQYEVQIEKWLGQQTGKFNQKSLEKLVQGQSVSILKKMDNAVEILAKERIDEIQRQCERDLVQESTILPLPIFQGFCSQSLAFAYGGMGLMSASQATSVLILLGSSLSGVGAFFAFTAGSVHLLNEARPQFRRNALNVSSQNLQERVRAEREKILNGLMQCKFKAVMAEMKQKECHNAMQIAQVNAKISRITEKANCKIESADLKMVSLEKMQNEAIERAEKSELAALQASSAVQESRDLLARALARADVSDAAAAELRLANSAIEQRFEAKLQDKFNALIQALKSNPVEEPTKELFQRPLQREKEGSSTANEICDEATAKADQKMKGAEDDEFEHVSISQESVVEPLHLASSKWPFDFQNVAADTLIQLSESP